MQIRRASLVNFGCAWNPPKTAKGIASNSISGTFEGKLRGWSRWTGYPLRGDRWMKHPKTWCRMNKWSKQTTDYFSNMFIWSESISIYFSCSIHVCSRFETAEKSGLFITAVCILTRLGGKRAGMVRDWSDIERNWFQTWPPRLIMALVFQRIDQFLHSLCLLRGVILIQNKIKIQNISDPIFLLALQILLPCGHGSKVGRRPYTTGHLPIRLANPWMKAHDLAIWTCLRQVEQWKRRFPEMWLAKGTTIFDSNLAFRWVQVW